MYDLPQSNIFVFDFGWPTFCILYLFGLAAVQFRLWLIQICFSLHVRELVGGPTYLQVSILLCYIPSDLSIVMIYSVIIRSCDVMLNIGLHSWRWYDISDHICDSVILSFVAKTYMLIGKMIPSLKLLYSVNYLLIGCNHTSARINML